MTALPEWARAKAACAGIDPRTMYEDAWKDKTGRPAPGLAKALAICGTCRVVGTCLVAGLDERWGVWGGAVPPERGQAVGIRNATDADPIEVIHRLGGTSVRVEDDGTLTFDVPAEEIPAEPVTRADIDAAYRTAWDRAAETWGSYADVPAAVQKRLAEGHRRAHVRRAAAEVRRLAAEVRERYPDARCAAGHDLTAYLPSGKPMLTPTGKCRLCLPETTDDPETTDPTDEET